LIQLNGDTPPSRGAFSDDIAGSRSLATTGDRRKSPDAGDMQVYRRSSAELGRGERNHSRPTAICATSARTPLINNA
jgi:hypothetical protein